MYKYVNYTKNNLFPNKVLSSILNLSLFLACYNVIMQTYIQNHRGKDGVRKEEIS